MFQKILVANRGEIAVRIIRTCREMGITSVALYEPSDIASLHVRLADECTLLDHPDGFFARDEIVRLARQTGADAIHPGYGFLAERPDFIYACQQAGITFIGPPAETVALVRDKVAALEIASRAGFPTVAFAALDLQDLDLDVLAHRQVVQERADALGYPLVIKPGSGGSGKGERLVSNPEQLFAALSQTTAPARAAFCTRCVYLEKAIFPAYKITVPVLRDGYGHLVQLGESQAYLFPGNQKLIEETPAPYLDPAQRQALHGAALDLARLFHLTNLATLSFVVDQDGRYAFTEVKTHLPIEHPVFEMVYRMDLVRQQICLAAGRRLALQTGRLETAGAAMLCRINAEDPEQHFLPSPGRLSQARFPGGQEVRLDSYVYPGCDVPGDYDPLIAKLAVWGEDRLACLQRLRSALRDCKLSGVRTNLALIKEHLYAPDFVDGCYAATLEAQRSLDLQPMAHPHREDLAVIAGLLHQQRLQSIKPIPLERSDRSRRHPAAGDFFNRLRKQH